MSKVIKIIGVLIFVALAVGALTLISRLPKTGDGAELPRLWHAPDFNLPNQHAQKANAESGTKSGTDASAETSTEASTETSTESLRGKVWIANFIFTQCTSACPLLTAKMVLLQRQITSPDVRFVSFSVDPAHDTSAALAAYAQEWNAAEQRWLLLRTSDESLAAIAKQMQVPVDATGDKNNPIMHSSTFFLIDQSGVVRGRYASLNVDLKRLVKDVQTLTAGSELLPAVAADLTGPQIFDTLRCASCHDHANLAPALAGLPGSTVHLADGTTVQADDDYIRESIKNPSLKMVQGYVPLMPKYKDYLSEEQIQRLVAHIHSLEAVAGAAPQKPVLLVTDPICGMQVRATADAPHMAFAGHDYYFCSDQCRTTFAADPQAALKKATGNGDADAGTGDAAKPMKPMKSMKPATDIESDAESDAKSDTGSSTGAAAETETTSAATTATTTTTELAIGQVVQDPLCQMQVRVTADTPHAAYAGTLYYFCSADCQKSFVAAPEKYVGAAAAATPDLMPEP